MPPISLTLEEGGTVNIGEAAAQSGVSAKMIRYYERMGLIPPAGRSASGYRIYGPAEVQALRVLNRARGLGFSAGQMRALMALWGDQHRASADVKRLALGHAAALDAKARDLAAMSLALRHLAEGCGGDAQPDCAILDGLAAPLRTAPRSPEPSRSLS